MKQLLLFAFLCAGLHLTAQRVYEIKQSFFTPEYGVWNDNVWVEAPVADSFITSLPAYGRLPTCATSVQMCISGSNLLVKAICSSNRVRDDGSLRDATGEADYFSVGLDTWQDHQNAFVFTVTASGQHSDQRITGDQIENGLNIPWYSDVQRTAKGWSVCLTIPFSSLRFPSKREQNWGVQFTRFDRATGETSTWNPQNPLIEDKVWQYGQIQGIGKIKNRTRASLAVYSDLQRTVRQINAPTFTESRTEKAFGYGLDARINLQSASTLDFTIIPGFHTHLNDNNDHSTPKIVTRLYPTNETRPMLLEERSLFHRSGGFDELPVFQSGWNLINRAGIIGIPSGGLAINSAKFVTQTSKNFRLGIANTIYQRPRITSFAPVLNVETLQHHPIYNYLFAEKLFRNNSFLHIALTNGVIQEHLGYQQIAVAGQLRDRKNRFQVKGNYVFYNASEKLQNQSEGEGKAAIAKINGKWTGEMAYSTPDRIAADSFLPPALYSSLFYPSGFHSINAYLKRRNFTCKSPFWLNTAIKTAYSSNWGSKNTQMKAFDQGSVRWEGLTRHFQTFALSTSISSQRGLSYFYIGGLNLSKEIQYPVSATLSFTTDYRKRSVFSTQLNFTKYITSEQHQNSFLGEYRYSPNKFINIQYSLFIYNKSNELTQAFQINNKDIFAYYNNIIFSNHLQLLLRYSSHFLISGGIGILPKPIFYQQRTYELSMDKGLIPVDFDLPYFYKSAYLNPQFTIHYFQGASHVQITYNRSNLLNYYYRQELTRSSNSTNVISVSFIWNISQNTTAAIKKSLSSII